ncbi:hypothetical protein Btru_003185 [Bulinus truncatus]|nr:hypothetical protein Btru_003185 [Bulinus truncatus]
MLGNIANDLDSLLSDLCITDKDHRTTRENPSQSGTLHSADTIGKDSFFSSAGNTSKRQGDAVPAVQKYGYPRPAVQKYVYPRQAVQKYGYPRPAVQKYVYPRPANWGVHRTPPPPPPATPEEFLPLAGRTTCGVSAKNSSTEGVMTLCKVFFLKLFHFNCSSTSHSLSDNDHVNCESLDSGHEGRRRPGPSPLVFDPHHFSVHQPHQLEKDDGSQNMDEFRPISTLERVIKTNSIWLLSSMSRAGAVHLLKDRDTGNFIVRKSSQSNSLALSVQSRLNAHSSVDHYLIENVNNGFRLHGSLHSFHSIPALVAYHIENIDEIPYHLRLPKAIQLARSTRELASLDMLGQDFWVSPLSRKSPSPEPSSGILHKSSSEPINIQRPFQMSSPASGNILPNTAPSRSATDFSHFMSSMVEMEHYFEKHLQGLKSDSPQLPTLGSSAHQSILDKDRCMVEESSVDKSAIPAVAKTFQESVTFTQKHSGSIESSSMSSFVNGAKIIQVPSSKSHIKCLASEEKGVLFSSPCFSSLEQTPTQPPKDNDIYRANPSNLPYFKQVSCSDAAVNTNTAPSGVVHDRTWTVSSTATLKTNLYSTTNLGLLEIPENSYFKSNLSDKLSDYEDIWRTSCCESDAERHSKLQDPRTVLEIKVNKSKNTLFKESKKKVLKKTVRDSPLSHNVQMIRDAVTGGNSGLTALELARKIARSDSEDESPVTHSKLAVKMDNELSGEVTPLNKDQRTEPQVKYSVTGLSQDTAGKCVNNMPQPVRYNQITSQNKAVSEDVRRKPNLSPLGRLSRLKSSSESSLATASSPLYAEPVDAVRLRDKNGKAINIQVRRLSTPLSVNQLKDQPNKTSHKVSKHPQLDTILSPDAQTGISPLQNKFSFETSVIKNHVVPLPGNKLSRSYSMRTPHEMSQLQRKLSWKDRLNRLKLGTKVLTRNLTPPSVLNARQKNLGELNLIDLDSGQVTHDVSITSTTPRKFPVDSAEIQRASEFSESSTVQDLITCVHPELTVCPIARPNRGFDCPDGAPPSEYDNLQIYRASAHSSSQGTVYSPPWESSTANRLMRDPPAIPPALPPAMDFTERIQRWQLANNSYHGNNNSSTCHGNNNNSHHGNISSSHHGNISSSHHKGNQVFQFSQPSHPQHVQLIQHHHQHTQVEYRRETSKGQTTGQSSLRQNDRVHQVHAPNDPRDILHLGFETQECLESPQLSNITVPSNSQTFTSANLADISSSAHTTSPQRLSSHCPDVVNCHSSPAMLSNSTSTGLRKSDIHVQDVDEDDVLFSGEIGYASDDLKQRLRPVLSPQTSLSQNRSKSPGTIIKEYIFKLSSDHQTIFGSTIENFIQCTLESNETNPQYVMRNVRQFMTGIKNYLVKHGEGELEDLIERERNKLCPTEILNIDAIIEQALHVCVLKPLKFHIYCLFVEKYSKNSALEQLSKNIKYARTKSAQDIGVKPSLKLPDSSDMEDIRKYLDRMQKSYSPLQKLQNLLKATSRIYMCVQGRHHQLPSRGPSSLGADDFLPMLIYVIVHCGLVSAEIEADFMWGLLQPSLLTGEGGYYLTTLSSAVLILKNFQETHQMAPNLLEGKLPTISDMQGFLKIAIPDELHGSITWKTLPVRPNMNSKDVCSMVAHKFRVTNPQDYGLYLLCDGQESHLADSDCPQLIKGDIQTAGKNCYFAFKRLDANIAWPRHLK